MGRFSSFGSGINARQERHAGAGWAPLAIVAALTLSLQVLAQDLGPAIETNDYTIDIAPGPVMGGSRIVGLGGAYTGIAERVDSLYVNPAGLSVKSRHSRSAWEVDWTLDYFLLGLTDKTDYENNGSDISEDQDFLALDLGLAFRLGRIGLGSLFRMRRYALDTEDLPRVEVLAINIPVALAAAFFDDQLALGLEAHWQVFNLNDLEEGDKLVGFSGATAGLSAIARPRALPMRVGVSAMLPGMSLRDSGGEAEGDPLAVRGLVLPRGVAMPWRLNFGISAFASKRPYNYPRPSASKMMLENEDESDVSRVYALVSMDIEVVGSADNATGVVGFIRQERHPAGEQATISPRLGVESEIIDNWLVLRGGTYYEPSRFNGVEGRWHGTGGFDLRLFSTSFLTEAIWKVSTVIDGARDYLNLGLSVGWWH